ncbi:MAG: glycosyltransferase family 4 protein [Chloroflexota bacterium]|nr:MAG: glycosyl transferase family 1 [Bellilinea sp.]
MKILFLTQIVPYPPDAGPRIKTWHVLKYLSEQGYTITLLTFTRQQEEKFLPEVQKICKKVISIPLKRTKLYDFYSLLVSQLKRTPFLIERDYRRSMENAVSEILRNEKFDVIHIDQINMAQFIFHLRETPLNSKTIFDAHNATWIIPERMKANSSFFIRPFLSQEASKLRNYEEQIVHIADHVLTVSEFDRNLLLPDSNGNLFKSKIHVIPIAVNTQELLPIKRDCHAKQILTIGSLNYPPNADGVRWFLREVFPIVKVISPNITLTVIGKNPPKDFFTLAAPFGKDITITGYVEELNPYLASSALMVVPVLAGGGMRVRILESFSRGIPVVTTSIGLEGISANNGEHLLVADDPETFARHVVYLINNPAEQERLANNARELVVNRYDWKSVLKELISIYQSK